MDGLDSDLGCLPDSQLLRVAVKGSSNLPSPLLNGIRIAQNRGSICNG